MAPKTETWQPIETMPHRELVLLAYDAAGQSTLDAQSWSAGVGRHNGVSITDNHGNPISFVPTHWMRIEPLR